MSDDRTGLTEWRRSSAGPGGQRPDEQRPSGAPSIELVDARTLGLADEAGLREHCRELCTQIEAQHASRSYSYPLALIATHSHRVGCDIERVAPCDEAFADSIRTPAERAAAEHDSDRADRDRRISTLWSGKEALAKALGDALDYDPRRLDGPGSWPDGRSGPWRAQEIELPDGYVGWVCWWVTES